MAYFSQPVPERKLYRHLRSHPCRSILEVGLGMAERTQRVLRVARRFSQLETIRYTGIDLFEARPANAAGLKLKEAHQRLQLPGVKSQLVPGDPFSALSRIANNVREIDLLIVGADQDPESLARAWYYMPRMLHAPSVIFWQRAGADPRSNDYQVLRRADVDRLAEASAKTLRRAS